MPDPTPPLRVLCAGNASALTGTGTNTYLIGRGEVAVVDPGPDLASHLAAILAATAGERISRILVTHAHLDHSALAPRLAALTGAPVLAFGRADSGRSTTMTELARQGLTSSEGADQAFAPDQTLADGDRVMVGDSVVEALHLPGHMGCHLGFALGDGLLLSGDHVMGWSTSLVSPPDGDMAAYMSSLHRLTTRTWSRMYPGHGPEIADPGRRLAELITHRLSREAAILAALRDHGPASPAAIAAQVYRDVAPHLLPAATRNVLAHLIDLTDRALVHSTGQPLDRAIYTAR
ncbi:MAG: MBL fold metallo-hydrolase [bacterium]